MFAQLARFLIRHRRPVLVAAGVFFVVAGALGGTVADHLSRGGFDDPGAESVLARHRLENEFGGGLPAYVLVVTPTGGGVDDPAVAARGRRLTEDLAGEPGVAGAVSYWTTGAPDLRGRHNHALVVGFLTGSTDHLVRTANRLSDDYVIGDDPVLTTRAGGFAAMFDEIGHQVEKDFQLSEAISLPIILAMLVVIFGGLVAAGVPLGIGLLAIGHLPRTAHPERGDRGGRLLAQHRHRLGPRPGHRLRPAAPLPLPGGVLRRPQPRGRHPGSNPSPPRASAWSRPSAPRPLPWPTSA